jgi:hypothetical protein
MPPGLMKFSFLFSSSHSAPGIWSKRKKRLAVGCGGGVGFGGKGMAAFTLCGHKGKVAWGGRCFVRCTLGLGRSSGAQWGQTRGPGGRVGGLGVLPRKQKTRRSGANPSGFWPVTQAATTKKETDVWDWTQACEFQVPPQGAVEERGGARMADVEAFVRQR